MSGALLEWALGPAGRTTALAILVALTGAALLLTMRRRRSRGAPRLQPVQIRLLAASGVHPAEIARRLRVPQDAVSMLLRERTAAAPRATGGGSGDSFGEQLAARLGATRPTLSRVAA